MDPMPVIERLAAIEHRAAGTDAERRAARLLASELRALGRRAVLTQTFWTRPYWPAVHAFLAAVGVAASVVSVDHPRAGLAVGAAALVAFALDLSGRFTPLRRATVERATQNVVSLDMREDAPVRLVITAATDTPRATLLATGAPAGAAARLRVRLGGHLPSLHGWIAIALVATIACCVARVAGVDARWLGALQLVPSVVLLLAVAVLVDALTASVSAAGATANAGAAAVALALVSELTARPPRALAVDVVFAGAGENQAAGMRRWVRAQRRAGIRPEGVCVLHVAPCGAGRPVYWTRDGLVLPLRYHPRLIAHCEAVAAAETRLGAGPHESRGASGARAARAAGWPAIAIGSLPRSGAMALGDADTLERIDPGALRDVVDLALGMVARLDAELSASGRSTTNGP